MKALYDVARAAKQLTVLYRTKDGGIVVGPQGWDQLQTAITRYELAHKG